MSKQSGGISEKLKVGDRVKVAEYWTGQRLTGTVSSTTQGGFFWVCDKDKDAYWTRWDGVWEKIDDSERES